jgi:hypothetical protein
VIAGFHEVVVSKATTQVIAERRAAGKSLWRISSTLFGHIQSDQILEPLGQFKNNDSLSKFPPILAGDQVTVATDRSAVNFNYCAAKYASNPF